MTIRELLATLGLKVDTASFKRGDDAIEAQRRRLEQLKKAADFVNKAMLAVAKVGAAAFVGLGVAAAKVGGEFESLRASLKTVTGSSEAASAAFKKIQKFAASTPFSVKEITQAFIKLKALGLDPSERALKSYGNTSSAMGKTLSEMIEAVADASTGEFERLKEFGIKASSQGDQVAFTFQGVTTTVGKNAKEIQEYLLRIGETKFAGAMDEQAKTLNGVLSNLGDAFESFLDQVAQNGLLDALKEVGREMGAMGVGGDSLAKTLGQALGKAVKSLWTEGKKLIPVFAQMLHQLPSLVSIFGSVLKAGSAIVGAFAKFSESVGGVDTAIKVLLPGLVALKVATIAAAGPWGVLAAAMLAAIPIAMEVGDAIGKAMSNAVHDIDGMTRRLHGRIAKTRGNKLNKLKKGEAGYEIAVANLRDMDVEDLDRMVMSAVSGSGVAGEDFISADMMRAAMEERDRRSAGEKVTRDAKIDLEYATNAATDAMKSAATRGERILFEQLARRKRRGERLSPSESKRLSALQKKLDITPNTKRGKAMDFDRDGYERAVDAYRSMGLAIPKGMRAKYMSKHSKKKHLSADEQLAHDFGNGVHGGKTVNAERASLGTTINRIENRYDPKVTVTVQATQQLGEDSETFAARVAKLARETIEREVLRPGYDHFQGLVGA